MEGVGYGVDEGVLSLLSTFFGGIWEGLSTYNIPGTEWSFAGFFIAVFTAGIIGKILKSLFTVFGSHFDSGRSSGKRSGSFRKGEELDD